MKISDHLIQFLILQGLKERSLPQSNLYRRDFSNFNEREFEEVILSMNWENICVKMTLTFHLTIFSTVLLISWMNLHLLRKSPKRNTT